MNTEEHEKNSEIKAQPNKQTFRTE